LRAELLKSAFDGLCERLRGGCRFPHVGRAKASVNFTCREMLSKVWWDRDTEVQDAGPRPV
jgi:hypothetical protein